MALKDPELTPLSYKLIFFLAIVVFVITFGGYISILFGGGQFEKATVIQSDPGHSDSYTVRSDSGRVYTLSTLCILQRSYNCKPPAVGARVTAVASERVQYSLSTFIAVPIMFVISGFTVFISGIIILANTKQTKSNLKKRQ
ncbi:hypothetical protein KC952_00895 [Candidatus Saccharibacteria bacterium]|nr:hypothetical protein [Candidatus Saccharibacteria bacterium]